MNQGEVRTLWKMHDVGLEMPAYQGIISTLKHRHIRQVESQILPTTLHQWKALSDLLPQLQKQVAPKMFFKFLPKWLPAAINIRKRVQGSVTPGSWEEGSDPELWLPGTARQAKAPGSLWPSPWQQNPWSTLHAVAISPR